MARTTLDIDTPILADLKQLQKRERKSLGRLVSDLLAEAIDKRPTGNRRPCLLNWTTRSMEARVDLSNKNALMDILGSKEGSRRAKSEK